MNRKKITKSPELCITTVYTTCSNYSTSTKHSIGGYWGDKEDKQEDWIGVQEGGTTLREG